MADRANAGRFQLAPHRPSAKMPRMQPLLEVHNVSKSYGAREALCGVSLALSAPRTAVLGPNGAGKSTLLKIILGLMVPDEGAVHWAAGSSGDGVAKRTTNPGRPLEVAYMPERGGLLVELTALDFVTLGAELSGLPAAEALTRAHQVLHYVGLGEARYRKLGSFSTGMRQRALLAQAIVCDPKLVLLDEPTSGLDPRGREEMLDLIRRVPTDLGMSVILSTHILPDVEKTCDEVVLLDQGSVRYQGPVASIVHGEGNVFEVRTKEDPGYLQTALQACGWHVRRQSDALWVTSSTSTGLEAIFAAAVESGHQIRHLAPIRKGLEQALSQLLDAPASGASAGSDSDRSALKTDPFPRNQHDA